MSKTSSVAVITGGNRGLGFEAARQLARKGMSVILTARSQTKADDAARKLSSAGTVTGMELDVSSAESIDRFARSLREQGRTIQVLVNNAGIMIDDENEDLSAFKTTRDTLRKTMETNVYGPLELTAKLSPLFEKGANVINLSSGMGQLSDMGAGYPAYRISKTAINAVTRIFSNELRTQGVKVNSVSPGWVKTDMGGDGAPLSAEQGVRTVVWLATQGPDGPNGQYFDEDQERMDW